MDIQQFHVILKIYLFPENNIIYKKKACDKETKHSESSHNTKSEITKMEIWNTTIILIFSVL